MVKNSRMMLKNEKRQRKYNLSGWTYFCPPLFSRIITKVLCLPRNLINIGALNRDYIDSGNWKCAKSPSGAHHWIIFQSQMTCKHCTESRQVMAPHDPYADHENKKLEHIEAQFAAEQKPQNNSSLL